MQNAEIKKQFVNLIAKQAEILTAVVNPFYLGRLSILTPEFQSPFKKAQIACQESGIDVECNFSLVGKIVETGIATKEIEIIIKECPSYYNTSWL